jgi:hypothetical protein
MALRCTGCLAKYYNKDWKLRRHLRQSIPCFERVYPGEPLPARFKCSKCDQYKSAQEQDVKRHLHRIHHLDPETAESSVLKFTPSPSTFRQVSTPVDTAAAPDPQQTASSSAHQDQVLELAVKNARPNETGPPASGPSTGSMILRTLHPISCLQRTEPPITQEGSHESSDRIGRIGSRLISPSRIGLQRQRAKQSRRPNDIGVDVRCAPLQRLSMGAKSDTTVKVGHGRLHYAR